MSTAFQSDAFQPNAWQILAGDAGAPIEVPGVVGQTQEDGTTALEAAGFVVAVVTEHSASPAGTITYQSPPGGSFALSGSTVTITVSLGPLQDAVGGWPVYYRRRRKKQDDEPFTPVVEEIAEALQEANERKAKAESELKNAKTKSDRVLAELKAIYAEQDAIAFQIAFAKARRELEEDDLILLLAMM